MEEKNVKKRRLFLAYHRILWLPAIWNTIETEIDVYLTVPHNTTVDVIPRER